MSAAPARRPAVLVLTCGTLAALLTGAPPSLAADPTGQRLRAQGTLTDLSATADPTDGATARVTVNPHGQGGTTVVLHVDGLATASPGDLLGAHVHVGPCLPGQPAAAGPHWRTSSAVAAGPTTEVWLDLRPTPGGVATAVANVPFQVPPGTAQSVVVHALPTASDGSAGGRLACLPVPF